MKLIMSLKEFVELCNNLENVNFLPSSKNDKAAELAATICEFKGLDIEERKEKLKIIKIDDAENKAFIECLIERGMQDEYIFLQDTEIKAKINPFDPYIDNACTNYSQKWHILISLLAMLDTASMDEKYKKKNLSPFKVNGKINKIEYYDDENKPKLRIQGTESTFTYTANWVGWVGEACKRKMNVGL